MPDADDFDVEYLRNLLKGKAGTPEKKPAAAKPAKPKAAPPAAKAKRPPARKRR